MYWCVLPRNYRFTSACDWTFDDLGLDGAHGVGCKYGVYEKSDLDGVEVDNRVVMLLQK